MKTCLVLVLMCVLCLSLWHIHASVISRPGCTDRKGNFVEPGKSYFDGCNWCQCLYPQIDICTKNGLESRKQVFRSSVVSQRAARLRDR